MWGTLPHTALVAARRYAMPRSKMVEVENVNVPGRVSNVDADRYEAMRAVLLDVLPGGLPGLTQAEMSAAVLPHLPQDLWPNGEKSMWWVKTVQLDLEAKGLVVRSTASRPTRWYRS
jgi:hypothetical protein